MQLHIRLREKQCIGNYQAGRIENGHAAVGQEKGRGGGGADDLGIGRAHKDGGRAQAAAVHEVVERGHGRGIVMTRLENPKVSRGRDVDGAVVGKIQEALKIGEGQIRPRGQVELPGPLHG